MDSRLFEHWFESCLIPSLPSNSTAVLDNATFHNKKRLVALAQKYGCSIVFLPHYSPQLNEIEKFWGWLKGKLKKIVHHFDDFNHALCCCFNFI